MTEKGLYEGRMEKHLDSFILLFLLLEGWAYIPTDTRNLWLEMALEIMSDQNHHLFPKWSLAS